MNKIHLFGVEGNQWAIDEDFRAFEIALKRFAELVPMERAEIIHSVWWERFLTEDLHVLKDRFVICNMDNPPFHYLKNEYFHRILPLVDFWIARSRESLLQLQSLGWNGAYVPYVVDTKIFNPEVLSAAEKSEFKKKWGIPEGKYLVGNFYRDTELSDLKSPKRQKAPEVIVEIAKQLCKNDDRFHFILAGPRRQYIRGQLDAHQIPYTYIGDPNASGDDFSVNRLNRSELAKLYPLIDVYLTCSRWEGGPQSVLEAAACRGKIVSNRIGLASDILDPKSIFERPFEAVDLLRKDVESHFLNQTIELQYQNILAKHTLEELPRLIQEVYEQSGISREKRSLDKERWIRPLEKKRPKGLLKWLDKTTQIDLCFGDSQGDFIELLLQRNFKNITLRKLDKGVFELKNNWLIVGLNPIAEGDDFKFSKKRGVMILDHHDIQDIDQNPMGFLFLKKILEEFPEALVLLPSCNSQVLLRAKGLNIKSSMVIHGLSLRASKRDSMLEEIVFLEETIGAADDAVYALRNKSPIIAPENPLFEEIVHHGGEFYSDEKQKSEMNDRMKSQIDFYRNSIWIASKEDVVEKISRVLERAWI